MGPDESLGSTDPVVIAPFSFPFKGEGEEFMDGRGVDCVGNWWSRVGIG